MCLEFLLSYLGRHSIGFSIAIVNNLLQLNDGK